MQGVIAMASVCCCVFFTLNFSMPQLVDGKRYAQEVQSKVF
jgi:hypothetical protein